METSCCCWLKCCDARRLKERYLLEEQRELQELDLLRKFVLLLLKLEMMWGGGANLLVYVRGDTEAKALGKFPRARRRFFNRTIELTRSATCTIVVSSLNGNR